jgi:hypothetical protein
VLHVCCRIRILECYAFKFLLHQPPLKTSSTWAIPCVIHSLQLLRLGTGSAFRVAKDVADIYKFPSRCSMRGFWTFFPPDIPGGWISISWDVLRFMLKRGEDVLRGRCVWPFDSNPWSMTSLHWKKFEKDVKLGNVMFKEIPCRVILFFSSIGSSSLEHLNVL